MHRKTSLKLLLRKTLNTLCSRALLCTSTILLLCWNIVPAPVTNAGWVDLCYSAIKVQAHINTCSKSTHTQVSGPTEQGHTHTQVKAVPLTRWASSWIIQKAVNQLPCFMQLSVRSLTVCPLQDSVQTGASHKHPTGLSMLPHSELIAFFFFFLLTFTVLSFLLVVSSLFPSPFHCFLFSKFYFLPSCFSSFMICKFFSNVLCCKHKCIQAH